MTLDLFLRLITILLLIAWRTYWRVTEKKADREKPKTKSQPSFFHKERVVRNSILLTVGLLLVLPLIGFPLLAMEKSLGTQLIGLFFVILGLGLAVIARHELGANWANAYEYQIKQKHSLITTGIYAYVRHPIYTGMIIAAIGSELVAQSYLFIVFIFFFLYAYQQGKREDKLLETHFGKQYREYKKRTKMLFPFIF